MAAMTTSSLAVKASASLLQSGVVASSSAVPSFSGLRATSSAQAAVKTGCSSGCKCSRHAVVVRAAAQSEGSQEALFASVSQSAPAAPAAGSSLVVPGILGAGLVGGAALALLTKGSGSSAAAPAAAPPADNGGYIPRAKRAAPAALATMAATFPNSMQEEAFVTAVAAELFNLGFRRDNCIALVNTCRDEVCRPIVNLIDREFGLSFNIAGLGGLVNCGKTGFKAAMSHSPEFPCDKSGKPRERYIFFGFPHVSVGESGEVGSLLRRGRGKPSSACGALIAIRGDITKGGPIEEDADNAEYVLLKKKVAARIPKSAEGPSLVQVTKAALQAITDDLEFLVSQTVDPATADYAVITGVQIHSGNQIPGEEFRLERTCDYIAPNAMYAVINGEKHILHCEINQISAIKSVPANQFA